MNALKRTVSVLLAAVLILCSLSFTVCAHNETPQAQTASAQQEEKIVANVYLVCRVLPNIFKGHMWLYFENLSDHNLTVGVYTLPPKQGVSVGTYSSRYVPSGFGIYYNVEAYRYNLENKTDNVYLEKGLTQKQFDRMSAKVARSNYWTHLTNCSFFSVTTWDIAGGRLMPYLMIPILTRLSIQIHPAHKEGLRMYYPKKNQIFKQKGFGSGATLVQTEAYK